MVPDRKPRSYWGFVLALGLIAGAGLTIVLMVWVVGLNYCPGQPCKYDDGWYSDPANGEQESRRWLPFAFGPNTTQEYGPGDEQSSPGYHDRQDLRAQESVARATNAIVWLTFLSLIVGAVGVASVVVTIGLNLQAIAVSKEVGEAQARAYVSVESVKVFVEIEADNIHWTIQIKLFNSGQSPATNIEASAYAVAPVPFIIKGAGRSAPSGKTTKVYLAFRSPLANFPTYPTPGHDGQIIFRTEPVITYRDVFMKGNERKSIRFMALRTFLPENGRYRKLQITEGSLIYPDQDDQ